MALWTSIYTLEASRYVVGRAVDDLRTWLHGHSAEVETVCSCAVAAQNQLYAVLLSQLLYAQSYIQFVELYDRITNLTIVSLSEGVSHTTAEDELIYLAQQILDDANLRRHLRASHDSYEWALDVTQHIVHSLNFLLHEVAQHLVVFVEILVDNGGRSMLAVSGTEGIHHIAVGI